MACDSLGLRIRRARERARLTQAEAARAIGVSSRAWGDWERGVKRPLNSIGAIEQLLGISLAETDSPADETEEALRSLPDLPPGLRDEFIELYRRRKASTTKRAG